MSTLHNPHDAFFKQFLAKPEIAEDFLRHHLPADVTESLMLTALELQNDTFVDIELREHFTDLLYRVPTKAGMSAFVYLLFEHKSYPESFVALQLLRYMVRNWERELPKVDKLSPTIALVIYHGRTKWSISNQFSVLFDFSEASHLRQYVPEFQYRLVDLSALSDAEIRGQIWSRVFQLILKHVFDERLIDGLPGILAMTSEL